MIRMAVIDDKVVVKYLQASIDKIFKILPLYEENNKTLDTYIQSVIVELRGFMAHYGSVGLMEYLSVVSTLEGLKLIIHEPNSQPIVKREVFKCIKTITKINDMLEGD